MMSANPTAPAAADASGELFPSAAKGEQPPPLDLLITRCYRQLRTIAARQLAHERAGISHHVTSLTHEAVLRIMTAADGGAWDRPAYFFAAFSEAMRRILVDAARRRNARKRRMQESGTLAEVDVSTLAAPNEEGEIIVVDDMLAALGSRDWLAAEVVRLRYFGGMTLAEVAATLAIPERTVDRRWAYARAWLGRHLRRLEHVPPAFPVRAV